MTCGEPELTVMTAVVVVVVVVMVVGCSLPETVLVATCRGIVGVVVGVADMLHQKHVLW